MTTISRSDLIVPDVRQRKVFDKGKLDDLKLSILEHGLLHAPVVQRQADNTFILVAGERRTRAIDLIAAEAEGHLTIDGDLHSALAKGRIEIVESDIAIPDKIPRSYPDLQVVYKQCNTYGWG